MCGPREQSPLKHWRALSPAAPKHTRMPGRHGPVRQPSASRRHKARSSCDGLDHTLCCSAALMLLVAVMEPDVGDSLPRIGDDHWFRFYMILGANGALAFLVGSCVMPAAVCCEKCRCSLCWAARSALGVSYLSVQRVPPAVRAQVNLTNFLVTRYTSALTLQVGTHMRLAGCHCISDVSIGPLCLRSCDQCDTNDGQPRLS